MTTQVLDGSEQILVIPQAKLEWMRHSPGLQACPRRRLEDLLSLATFVPRTEALEHSPAGLAWLQVIPYSLLTHDGKVFAYRRPARGAEMRLAGRCSVGIGGHVNPLSEPGPAMAMLEAHSEAGRTSTALSEMTISVNLAREVREEMGVDGSFHRLAGLLWDARDDVGRRHLGLVYVVDVADPGPVRPQAAEVEPLGWLTPAELRALPASDWEGWSGLLVPHVEAVLTVESPGPIAGVRHG